MFYKPGQEKVLKQRVNILRHRNRREYAVIAFVLWVPVRRKLVALRSFNVDI